MAGCRLSVQQLTGSDSSDHEPLRTVKSQEKEAFSPPIISPSLSLNKSYFSVSTFCCCCTLTRPYIQQLSLPTQATTAVDKQRIIIIQARPLPLRTSASSCMIDIGSYPTSGSISEGSCSWGREPIFSRSEPPAFDIPRRARLCTPPITCLQIYFLDQIGPATCPFEWVSNRPGGWNLGDRYQHLQELWPVVGRTAGPPSLHTGRPYGGIHNLAVATSLCATCCIFNFATRRPKYP